MYTILFISEIFKKVLCAHNYYGLLLIRTLIFSPKGACNNDSFLYSTILIAIPNFALKNHIFSLLTCQLGAV